MKNLHIVTPLWKSRSLSASTGAPVFLKMEALQPIGSFKIRGIGAACQASWEAGARSLVCASGGNAGYAVAYAGRQLGMAVTIVVPKTTSAWMQDILGEWELAWPGEQSGLPAGQIGRGTNTITAILDSCVIQENFVDLAPNGVRGMSVSVYNQSLGKWQQTWVDNQSGYLDFIGEFEDGKMVLSRKAVKDGKEIIQRMVWHNISRDQLDWNWEASQDGGKTWKVNWRIHYKRKKQGK
jgi:hypothetical protein